MAFVDSVESVGNRSDDKMFEDMDVDDTESNSKKNTEGEASEEGEVSGDEDAAVVFPPVEAPTVNKKPERRFDNRAGGFITGIDVFGKEEQARLVERAKRFGLDSSKTHTLAEKELKKLYYSVGANSKDSDKKLRFDCLTMHGTEAMSTKDVFEYFSDYAPSSVEWLDDNSCNITWPDNWSAVRALLGLSKPIKYPPKSEKDKKEKSNKAGKSSNSKESESDIIMLDDDSSEETTDSSEELAAEIAADPEAVDLDELESNLPPGRWRKGKTHPASDSILLQFARRSNGSTATEQDGRPTRLPQPAFGMVGLISSSRKQRMKKGLLVRPKHFQDDMGDERDFVVSDEEDSRNPWGNLAKSWGHIDRTRRPPEPYEDVFGAAIPPPPALLLPPLPPPLPPLPPTQPVSILNRVGYRPHPLGHLLVRRRSPRRARTRSPTPSLSPERISSTVRRAETSDVHRRLAEKRKRPSDFSDESSGSHDSDEEEWTKRIKAPRMRMYADDEEKRSKQRRPQSEDFASSQIDLRSRLRSDHSGQSSRSPPRVSSHRARSPYRREDLRRRNDRESARERRPVPNGASSVWLRLERPSSSVSSSVNERVKREDSDCDFDSDSESYDSRTSSSSESSAERVTVRSTARYARQSDEERRSSSSTRRSNGVRPTEKIDLRSKLNRKKSLPVPIPRTRSPLRIEIDNDEYYRLHGDKD